MAGQKKKSNKSSRDEKDLKNSVIVMLVLLCIFFATRTDVWLIEQIQKVIEYIGICSI